MAKQKPPKRGGANPMLRQVQQMQAEMASTQAALAEETVVGSAGGGMVKATATGAGDICGISISAEVVDPDDIEMLEDLVMAAVTDALRAAKEIQGQRMGAVTGGIDLSALGFPG